MNRLVTLTTAAALFALTACASSSGTDDAPEKDEGDEVMAQIMCEDFVERHLKSPSTAEFSDASSKPGRADQTWIVTGAVDSENAFGAMIRNDYTCTVKYVGDDEWQLVRMGGLAN